MIITTDEFAKYMDQKAFEHFAIILGPHKNNGSVLNLFYDSYHFVEEDDINYIEFIFHKKKLSEVILKEIYTSQFQFILGVLNNTTSIYIGCCFSSLINKKSNCILRFSIEGLFKKSYILISN